MQRIKLLPLLGGEDKTSALKNCIRNHYRHRCKWARRTETDAFRLYDSEIKEHPFAIDYYAGRFCVHYFASRQDDSCEERFAEVSSILHALFGINEEQIYWRNRVRRTKTAQYEKVDAEHAFFTVFEYGVPFRINLTDYLDTGLFLDHRETRQLVASLSRGKRVLNLFAYTGAFSVHAAMKGAAFTKSVDLSNTYTAWCRENFLLNGLPEKNNPIVRADCLKFLDEETMEYDLIILDPPTVSRSKKMETLFDIQVGYISLITKALRLLLPGGTLFFSTNSRKFHFDHTFFNLSPSTAVSRFKAKEITAKTLPQDFHDPKIHRCWTLVK